MPRLFQKRSGTWVEIFSVFQKQGGTWVEILNIFQKIGGTWTKVFAGSKVPGNTVAPTITGTGRLFGTLTNSNLGTWTNTPTSYSRQWRRGNPSTGGGEPTSYSNISGATSSTYVTTEADNGKYVICQITATNAVGSNSASSNSIYVNKFEPVSLLAYTIAGSPTVGSSLRADEPSNAWKDTTTISGDTYPDTFEFEWSYTDGTVIQSSTLSTASFPRNINSGTLLLTTADLNKQIRVRVKGVNTGGEATSSYSTSTAAVTESYRFSFGKTLYVSSNGHIGLDSGGSFTSTMSTGRNIAILVKDLEQYYLAEYSDTSVYYLYIRSYLFNSGAASSLNAVDYQIKFYNDSSINYCDVYMVRVGTNVTLPSIQRGYYNSGSTGYAGTDGASFFIGTGSTVRIYFGDTPMKTTGVSWTAVNDNLWDVIQTWTYPGGGGDDTFTSVVSATNQSAPFPVNTPGFPPTLTTDTGNFSAGSTIAVNTGSWSGTSSFKYELLYGTSTPVATDSTATKTLINTNQYVITNADATASSFYFRARVTGYGGPSQTGNSAVAFSETSSRSTLVPTSTIAVGTATGTGFTISGTAGPLNGFGTSYVSVSEIQIYNSSQTLLSTITTGLPTVDGTAGTWSYIWTGGSASTTYYAKAVIKATDSAQTTFTTPFSTSIETTAGTVTPTSLTATTNDSAKITLTWSGGSADTYLLYWLTGGVTSWPAQTFTGSDFTDTASPYEWGNGTPTNPVRGVTYYLFIRSRSGTSPNFTYGANWFPAQTTGIIGRAPLYAPPTPNTPTSSGITKTNITVSWTAGTVGTGQDAASSFEVYTSDTNSTPATTTSGTTQTSPASYTYTASASPTAQYFWVRAVNADAKSAWSSVLSATPTALNPPGVVSNVASTAKTSASITWSWSAPTTGGTPTGYEYAISTTTTEPSTFTNLGSTTRSVTTSSLTADTDYYLFVKAKNADGTSAAVRNSTAVKTSAAVTLYTVSFSANGATGSPSVSSVTQTTDGGSVTLATKGTMAGGTNRIFGGWRTGTSSGTVYAFGATFTPTANITLYAYYGTEPTCAAPSFTSANNFRRVNNESQIIWFTNYPTPSGAYTEIIGMQFQIDTGSTGGGTRLADATRPYPTNGEAIYTGAGANWQFKCGKDRSSVTSNRVDDVAFNTDPRYARVRVRMRGIDGVNYPGTFTTPWI